MPISEHASGTQTAVINTEHYLASADTTDGAFQFVVDMAAMVDGDELELRLKEAALGTPTPARQGHLWGFAHDQADDLFISPAALLLHGWSFTLKQTAGTGRSFPWSVRKVA